MPYGSKTVFRKARHHRLRLSWEAEMNVLTCGPDIGDDFALLLRDILSDVLGKLK